MAMSSPILRPTASAIARQLPAVYSRRRHCFLKVHSLQTRSTRSQLPRSRTSFRYQRSLPLPVNVWAQASPNSSVQTAEYSKIDSLNPEGDKWTVKMLYDGDCPLCMREVNMLRERNKNYDSIKFVDISAEDYSADQNAGIDFATAMGRIHVILRDGTILQDVKAFKKLYEEVGLGWVYAITNIKLVSQIADVVYSVWAKYRLPITGRPPLVQILEERQRRVKECDTAQCRID